MTPLPGIPRILGIPRACSKKLVWEQRSFTFADFCCQLTHLPGIPRIPRASLWSNTPSLLLTFAVC